MVFTDLINPENSNSDNWHQWQLEGCLITPIGNYLKALELLRIIPDL